MTILVEADELYPVFEIVERPTRFTKEMDLPEDVVARYQAAKAEFFLAKEPLDKLFDG